MISILVRTIGWKVHIFICAAACWQGHAQWEELSTHEDTIFLLQVGPGRKEGRKAHQPCLTTDDCQDNITRQCPEFIHIPKNAGSSVETAGYAHGVMWGARAKRFTPSCDGVYSDLGCVCGNGVHTPPALWRGAPNPYSGETFCVTRDPYDRIVSFFNMYGPNPSHPWGANAMTNDCTADALNLFVQTALQEYQNGQAGAHFKWDCLLVSQSEYIWGSDGHRWCDTIIRSDELPEAFDALMERTGCPVQFGRTHVNTWPCNVTSSSLSAEAMAAVESAYYDDFIKLGYPFSNRSRLPLKGALSARDIETAALREQLASTDGTAEDSDVR